MKDELRTNNVHSFYSAWRAILQTSYRRPWPPENVRLVLTRARHGIPLPVRHFVGGLLYSFLLALNCTFHGRGRGGQLKTLHAANNLPLIVPFTGGGVGAGDAKAAAHACLRLPHLQ
jgi:hypothetical protein